MYVVKAFIILYSHGTIVIRLWVAVNFGVEPNPMFELGLIFIAY